MENNLFYNAYVNFLKKQISPDVIIDNKNIQIIGVYDIKNKIWYNAWALYDPTKHNMKFYSKSKELLMYSINLEKDMNGIPLVDRSIIKYMLISSKIYITEEKIQLDILIATIIYLIKSSGWMRMIKNNLIYYLSVI